ncbi:MAG TPA: hypothetical protein VH560_19085 [Polyangia bacterium]|nr:hypothetical protein [Polyangia bacterium]
MTARGMVLLVGLVLFLGTFGCGSGGKSCQHNADCANSATGRGCVPTESWCADGHCESACRPGCKTIEPDVNTCAAPLICNDDGKTALFPPYCTGTAIPCGTAADCPLFRPAEDAGQAVWSCEDGGCRYPGLDYVIGAP